MSINNPNLTLRPEAEQDKAFLERLYRSTRDDLLQLGLPDPMIDNLIQMQFSAQQTGYRIQFPNGDYVIAEKNGEPIGYQVTDHGDKTIRLVYIAFLPNERNKGHGRHLIETLQNQAAGVNKILTLTVDPRNLHAQHLYLSSGFQINGDDDANIEMSWP